MYENKIDEYFEVDVEESQKMWEEQELKEARWSQEELEKMEESDNGE